MIINFNYFLKLIQELIDNKGLKLSVYSIKLRIVFDKLQTNLQKV